MELSKREVVIVLASATVGVLATIGVQKGVKTLKTRSARKKAEKALLEAAKESDTTHKKVDEVFDISLNKLPGETDAEFNKRMDHIIAQTEEAKHKKNMKASVQ